MCEYGYDYQQIGNSRTVTTRTVQECGSCMKDFPPKTRMVKQVGKTEGEFGCTYCCPACAWALDQEDHTDLHLCWGWNWDPNDEYDDANERWDYISATLAAGKVPTIEEYKARPKPVFNEEDA